MLLRKTRRILNEFNFQHGDNGHSTIMNSLIRSTCMTQCNVSRPYLLQDSIKMNIKIVFYSSCTIISKEKIHFFFSN